LLEVLEDSGLRDLDWQDCLRHFHEFYDGLAPRPLQALCTTKIRALARYQADEDAAAAREGVVPRNLAARYERGAFFAPDIEPHLLHAAYEEAMSLISEQGGLDLRPTPEEQAEERERLKKVVAAMELSEGVAERIVGLRERAWQQMPEAYPPSVRKLLDRTPTSEELEAMVAFYRRGMEPSGMAGDILESRLEACKAHYAGRPPSNEPLDAETRELFRENYRGLMEHSKMGSKDEIEERLRRYEAQLR